jgi:DNA-binding MarR family transcriptional regulator
MHMNTKRELPIRSSEMGVLIFTQKQDRPVTPLMISQFFKITKPSVSAMVSALIKSEYLMKEPSATDGRSYTLKPTEKGRALVEATFEDYFKSMERLKEKMGTEDFDRFIGLIERANRILAEGK